MGVAMTGPGPLSSSVDHHIQQQQQQHQQQQQMEQRDLNRTPVNALVDQFQNGINFHHPDGNTAGYNAQRSMMNRSRSPGRELDSMPTQQQQQQMHYENGLPPDANYGNGYPPAYESDYGRMGSQSRLPRADPYAPNPYSGSYSMDATRQMDYG